MNQQKVMPLNVITDGSTVESYHHSHHSQSAVQARSGSERAATAETDDHEAVATRLDTSLDQSICRSTIGRAYSTFAHCVPHSVTPDARTADHAIE